MSSWITWTQSPVGNVAHSGPVHGTFCIVKDNEEYVTEVSTEQLLDDIQPEDAGKWQMVRMSQVTTHVPRSSAAERVKCPECHKTFSSSAYMRDHMRIHTGEKPYVCEECGIAFAQKCNLRMHHRIHTGERPYICSVCEKTFYRSSHLKVHMLQHTGYKPYQCDICGQQFTNLTGKRKHEKLHASQRPFKCEMCGITFEHKKLLKIHIKTSHKDSRYCCVICKRKFALRSALYDHMTFHSKSKHFECEQCNKRFKNKNYLKTHKRTKCNNQSLLFKEESNVIKELSHLKYRALSVNERAQPQFTDSEDEDCDIHNDTDSQYLDQKWAKVLHKLENTDFYRPHETSA